MVVNRYFKISFVELGFATLQNFTSGRYLGKCPMQAARKAYSQIFIDYKY